MSYLNDSLGICEDDIEYCLSECDEALDTYVGSANWTEEKFNKLTIDYLKANPLRWDYSPTFDICEAMLKAAKAIAAQHGVKFEYFNNARDTQIWISED